MSCIVFFRTPQGQGKLQALSRMSASIICNTIEYWDLLFHYTISLHFLVFYSMSKLGCYMYSALRLLQCNTHSYFVHSCLYMVKWCTCNSWIIINGVTDIQYCAKVMQANCANFVLCSRELSSESERLTQAEANDDDLIVNTRHVQHAEGRYRSQTNSLCQVSFTHFANPHTW